MKLEIISFPPYYSEIKSYKTSPYGFFGNKKKPKRCVLSVVGEMIQFVVDMLLEYF